MTIWFELLLQKTDTCQYFQGTIYILQCPGLKTEETNRQKRLRELIRVASLDDKCWELLTQIQKKKPTQGLYVYNNIVNRDPLWVKAILKEVVDGKIKITDLSKRAKEVPVGDVAASQRLRRKRYAFLKAGWVFWIELEALSKKNGITNFCMCFIRNTNL